ncbi:hypothetical protein VPH35_028736 [Triticum aestivum]
MLDQLGLAHETWNERYPGLLVYVGQSRTKVFAYLKDRIWQRIQWWKEKMLSKARKEILIMACAQAIPTFAMSLRHLAHRQLVLSFDDPNIRWSRFKHHMLEILHHSDIRGIAFRKPNDSIYTFPMPDCMCQQDGI